METLLEKGTFELEHMVESLRVGEINFGKIFENSRDAIAVCKEGVNIFINPAFVEMFGYKSKEEILGKSIVSLVARSERKCIANFIKHKLQHENISRILETIGVRKDKTEFDIEVLVSTYAINGESYCITILRDITERKKTEKLIKESRKRLEGLAKKIITIQESERQNISRELHDDTGQRLTALKIQLGLICAELPTEMESTRDKLVNASVLIDQMMDSLHSLAQDLRPPVLDTLGLEYTLEDLCSDFSSRVGIAIEYNAGSIPELSDIVQITLYRFLQEALNNIAKHSKATQVIVQLCHIDSTVIMRVSDNGIGFKFDEVHSGMGLENMKERLRLVGGYLEIQSHNGSGTSINAFVPVGINHLERRRNRL